MWQAAQNKNEYSSEFLPCSKTLAFSFFGCSTQQLLKSLCFDILTYKNAHKSHKIKDQTKILSLLFQTLIDSGPTNSLFDLKIINQFNSFYTAKQCSGAMCDTLCLEASKHMHSESNTNFTTIVSSMHFVSIDLRLKWL